MKHIKSIIRFAALLLLMVCTQTVQAQTYIMVHKTDGNILRVAISDVDSVTFFEKQIDDLSYDYVDLGLSVKWATCNLGAKSPEEYGSFFAWGETIDKYEYTSNNYKWYDTNGMVLKYNLWKALGDVDMKYRLDADDDAAHVLLGDGWRIPTYENFVELFERCYWEPSEQNGVWGFNVTSSINNNSIFLPLTGMISEGDTLGIGRYAYYYTNTLNAAAKDKSYSSIYSAYMYYNPYAYYYNEYMASYYRTGGSPIRPVYEPNASFDNNVIEVQGVVVDQKEITLDVGNGWWLGAYVNSNSDLYILPMYSSDNDSVATVDSEGYLYGVSEGQCTITVSWGDYSETCVVTVIKRTYELTLSADSLIMYAGQSQELIAMLNSDELPGFHVLWYSSDTATVEVDGGFIKAKAIGSSVITAQYDSLFAECIVIVKAIENEPVDLGLSVMWGSMNLGAFSPEDIGGYYAWGETEEKVVYDKSNYKWYDNGSYYSINKYNLYSDQGVVDMKYRLDLEDDAAHVLLGDNWRIPTIEEFSELKNYCSWELIENTDGVVVYKVTSSINGNSIILPLSYYSSNTLGTGGGLSNYAYGLELDYQHSSTTNYLDRWYGLVIRPVYANTGYDNILEVTGLTLSQDTVFTEPGQGCELYAYFNTNSDIVPSVRWHYYDEEVATVNNYGYVRAHGVGETKITASIGYDSAVCVVVVNEFVPVMEEVDLGLSVNWATCNIGASRPEFAGFSFGWGEIEPDSYSNYDKWWSDSLNGFTKYGDIDGKYNLDPEDDAANVIWGDGWRMPTYVEFNELINHCKWRYTSINGMSGYLVTSYSNGNSIFLPCGDYNRPIYWSSSVYESDNALAWLLYYDWMESLERDYGFSIRPVRQSESYSQLTLSADTLVLVEGQTKDITAKIYGSKLDGYSMTWSSSDTSVAIVSENGFITAITTGNCIIAAKYDSLKTAECFVSVKAYEPVVEYVDLGLSVNWATCNVGAMSPEEDGYYYAWGEIEPKSNYTEESYRFYAGYDSLKMPQYSKYVSDSRWGVVDDKTCLDLDDDVAHVILGGDWRMPNDEELRELLYMCDWEQVTVNGVSSFKVTSYIEGFEDKSIFIPITGSRRGSELYKSPGYYWSSTLNTDDQSWALYLYLSSYSSYGSYYRYQGRSVRPVFSSDTWKGITSLELDTVSLSMMTESTYNMSFKLMSGDNDYRDILNTTWSSDNPDIVWVDKYGTITTFDSVGTARITVEYGDLSASCDITVTKKTSEVRVAEAMASMSASMPVTGSRHNDMGYPSIMMLSDANGIDVVQSDNGYNWSGNSLDYVDRDYTYADSRIVWSTLYNLINTSNNAISKINSEMTDSVSDLFGIGQMLGLRAFGYWNLAQLYQFNYVGNEDKPCVPLITEVNAAEAKENGCARATVREVYAQIISDINRTIDLLEYAQNNGVERADKSFIDLAVAYGLRARVNLTMGNWAAAANDAMSAIDASSARPSTLEEASRPAFWDASEEDWMWGIIINEDDDVVNSEIVNWISHMGSFNYGYCWYNGGRQINKALFNSINSTDVRKGWWIDENSYSSNLTDDELYLINNHVEYAPYTQVKFAPYKNELYTETNANDVPLMRIEEMYLILAEGKAMSGAADAKSVLEDFVRTYRDPDYTCPDVSGSDLQDEIWRQRRIELWGEGLSWFDIMRLNKGVDRREAGYPDEHVIFNIAADDPILLWRIPKSEIDSNPLISEEDNNPVADAPKPVGYIDDPDDTYLTVYPTSLDLEVGDSYNLSYKTNSNEPIVWTSSNDSVAYVDAYGGVRAISEGYCYITAITGNLSEICYVSVRPHYYYNDTIIYNDTVTVVNDFVLSDDKLSCEFYQFRGKEGATVSIKFALTDQGDTICTSFGVINYFETAQDAQKAYDGLPKEYREDMNAVVDSTMIIRSLPEKEGQSWGEVMAYARNLYIELISAGWNGDLVAYLPLSHANKTVAAWYMCTDEERQSVRIESVFLFSDSTLLVTKAKVYSMDDGRDPDYGVIAEGVYVLLDGDYYNGVARVLLSDGSQMEIQISQGIMLAVGDGEFLKQENWKIPEPK